MANNLGKVIYLSEAQKETLFANGTITVRGQTIEYNDYDLYVTPSEIDIAPVQGSDNLITSGAVYNAIEDITYENKAAASDGTDLSLVTTGEKYNWNNATQKIGSISFSTNWSGSGPYTQVVTVTGATVTANSKVDLQPLATELEQLASDGVQALYIVNNNGTLTATAMGAAPSTAISMQCSVDEVMI